MCATLFFFTSFLTVLMLPCPMVSREEGSMELDGVPTSALLELVFVLNCNPCLVVASGNCCSGLSEGRRNEVLLELIDIKDCGPRIFSFSDVGKPGSFKSLMDSLLLGPDGILNEL